MNGLIRPHQLSEGDSLHRRRLVENYLDAAQRLNAPNGWALGDKSLRREDFPAHVWLELFPSHAEGMEFDVRRYGFVVPESLIEIDCKDSWFEGRYSWTLAIRPEGVHASKVVWAYPVVNGQSVFGGMDYGQVDQLIEYAQASIVIGGPAMDPSLPANETSLSEFEVDLQVSLGNTCTVTGESGRSVVGLMVVAIGGFTITKCTASLKGVPR